VTTWTWRRDVDNKNFSNVLPLLAIASPAVLALSLAMRLVLRLNSLFMPSMELVAPFLLVDTTSLLRSPLLLAADSLFKPTITLTEPT